MKFAWINHQPSASRLILIFAGWGMDEKPFAGIGKPGYDIAVIWGLLDDVFPIPLSTIEHYDETCILAWSFGVFQASRILPHLNLPNVTLTLAVNGSPWPVDPSRGIPPSIFSATVENLSPVSLSRFYRRMAGSSESFRRFSASCPDRSVDELRAELHRVASLASSEEAPASFIWDRVLIGERDAIFPPDNLKKAWSESTSAITVDPTLPHLPDWQLIIDRYITDKQRVGISFDRRRESYSANASVQQEVARRLAALLAENLPASTNPPHVIEIGCGDGTFTRELLSVLSPARLRLIDLAGSIPDSLLATDIKFTKADGEIALRDLPDSSVDIVVASSTIQWFNSPRTFFRHVARVLRPGGIAAFSTYGPATLADLTAITGNSLPYLSVSQLSDAVPGSCKVLHASSSSLPVSFLSVSDMLRHLRLTGVNAISATASVPLMRRIIDHYPASPDGSCSLTYNPLYLIFTRQS
ncbi:MAG: DUF452 family protein [Muribaculaceae bacterium]|nr:DUF452 family protein [Muribaculaceae bacterium]